MRVRCSHAESWTYPVPGEQRCRTCGTVRFTDYGALRPPGLPQALTPKPRDAGKADRAAATRIAKAPRRGWDPWVGCGSEQAGSGGRGGRCGHVGCPSPGGRSAAVLAPSRMRAREETLRMRLG
ncbi:DUF6255 family natural product biosynthesis protein [Streptomyces sp. NRRL B-1677]|uniref:DUF6255 family natural product biosynthesis protein n=1 Tax=Streptomyces sp. NRRL B-1677 TaxID=2682966 RepID=UPI003A7F2B36